MGSALDIKPSRLAAMVMAGGVNTIPLYEGYRPGYKALVEIGGQPAIRSQVQSGGSDGGEASACESP